MSTDERGERAQIAAGGLASARLAGHEPDPELDELVAAWVDGRLTLDDLHDWLDQQYATDPRSNR